MKKIFNCSMRRLRELRVEILLVFICMFVHAFGRTNGNPNLFELKLPMRVHFEIRFMCVPCWTLSTYYVYRTHLRFRLQTKSLISQCISYLAFGTWHSAYSMQYALCFMHCYCFSSAFIMLILWLYFSIQFWSKLWRRKPVFGRALPSNWIYCHCVSILVLC